jgi:hypothetical protein
MYQVALRKRVVVLVWAALLSLGAAGALAAYDDAPDDAPMVVVQPTPLQGNQQPDFAAGDGDGTASGNNTGTAVAAKTVLAPSVSAEAS